LLRVQFITDTIKAPTKAAENVVTLKPFITLPKNQNNKPFTTRENNPNVTMFNGRVNILIIGLINILNNIKHAPTTKVVEIIGFKLTPDITYVVANTEAESRIQCKIIFILYSL
jgi:hypothetical protein